MEILNKIRTAVASIVSDISGSEFKAEQVLINQTNKEFEGDFTVVVFPFVRYFKKPPEESAKMIAEVLTGKFAEIDSYNAVKGFLNLSFTDSFWLDYFRSIHADPHFAKFQQTGKKVLVEYSSPNTNKPLHLGHIRNILLGWACANILEAAGYEVVRTQVVNDRGIAICKSMLAWKLFGEGKTPESTDTKGDHFVGDYYVLFENKFKEEYARWQESPEANKICSEKAARDQSKTEFFKTFKNQYFNGYSELGQKARGMLLAWENNDQEVRSLWQKMNQWVYDGFAESYQTLGVFFDMNYYESETYVLGRDFVEKGLEKGVFYKKPDGSVWVDLSDAGLDQKIVLRADGTSVYITQDIGTAHKRYQDHQVDKMVYVVADEQNYHFQALFETLKKLGEPYADGLYHLSYGMVDLPTGKMKSREGTVVDADDLIAEIISEAMASSDERGELADLRAEEQENIIHRIGLAALKFFILKVHPKKRMVFDPKESLDLQGQTGPYIQNAYVRIQSVFRKSGKENELQYKLSNLAPLEKELIISLSQYSKYLQEAAENYDPSVLAHYAYELAKNFHRFYHHMRILNAETDDLRKFRLQLIGKTGDILKELMRLLGIEMPDRM